MRARESQRGGSDTGILLTVIGIAAIASAVLIAQSAIKGCKDERMRGPGQAEPTPHYPIERIETVEVRPKNHPDTAGLPIPTSSPSSSPQPGA